MSRTSKQEEGPHSKGHLSQPSKEGHEGCEEQQAGDQACILDGAVVDVRLNARR